jgi:hypothetical protein
MFRCSQMPFSAASLAPAQLRRAQMSDLRRTSFGIAL